MDSGEVCELFDGYKPTTRRAAVIGCRNTFPIEVTLEQGKAVFEYAQTLFTREALAASTGLEDFRLPRGFWQVFLQSVYTGFLADPWNACTGMLSGCTSQL